MKNLTLTREQKLIIKHKSGHAMVNAGAGCGKTSTLALRTKHLIKTGSNPTKIVIMTFGKALSEDIFKTLARHIDKSLVEQMTVSTIHSFAYQLVQKHYQLLGFTRKPLLLKKRTDSLTVLPKILT